MIRAADVLVEIVGFLYYFRVICSLLVLFFQYGVRLGTLDMFVIPGTLDMFVIPGFSIAIMMLRMPGGREHRLIQFIPK